MNWTSFLGVGFLSGVVGLFLAFCVTSACVSWYRISGFEGKAGYFVVFTSLFAGIVAVVVGLATCWAVSMGSAPGFGRALSCALGVITAIAAITALVCWWLADIPPKIDGLKLDLELELKLPAGETKAPAEADKWILRFGSVVNHRQRASGPGEVKVAEARLENGRWIIPASAFLFTGRSYRSISFERDGKSIGGFLVPLPAKPGKKFEQWSEWGPKGLSRTEPWPDSRPSYRFRVARRIPPPPEPDPAVVEAEKFAAMKPEAPLAEWLTFMHYDAPEERKGAVMELAEKRQTELAKLLASSDGETRDLAHSAVMQLNQIAPEISEAILAEGRDIAEAVRQFNDLKSDAPDFYDVQIQLRHRFSYWHRAWWRVHQLTGVDGRPPVQTIMDLALVRSKDTSMDEIVINAQAHLGGLKPADALAN